MLSLYGPLHKDLIIAGCRLAACSTTSTKSCQLVAGPGKPWSRQTATDQSADKAAHSKELSHHGPKRQIMGREVVVAITGGKLDFGPWEQIFYGEFDGRRQKRVLVKIIGD